MTDQNHEHSRQTIIGDINIRAEALIRSLDVKSQIGLAAFVLSVNGIFQFLDIKSLLNESSLELSVYMILFITTIIAYLLVIYPRNSKKSLRTIFNNKHISNLENSDQFEEILNSINLEDEINRDTIALSVISQKKSFWLKIALFLNFVFLIVSTYLYLYQNNLIEYAKNYFQ